MRTSQFTIFLFLLTAILSPQLSFAQVIGPPLPALGARFVSQNVRPLLSPGQSYQVSITMQNAGTTTWSAGTNFYLGSQNPQDNTN
ncbi:MAG TPA: hypothetical protein VMR06_17875 [Dokdonella sp.]|uniref:hypothetical protein n=1 Tax=Dokdonella sp. TaxID=2291710 RepID=UPI002CCA04A2|nr:hypothetical protein [Dokdonella sp.]HUD43858.1 hypothetical protein [Dokdonella sp.]